MSEVKHKGYTIIQSDYNNHCMIFNEEGKFVSHINCPDKKNEDELMAMLYTFLEFQEKVVKEAI